MFKDKLGNEEFNLDEETVMEPRERTRTRTRSMSSSSQETYADDNTTTERSSSPIRRTRSTTPPKSNARAKLSEEFTRAEEKREMEKQQAQLALEQRRLALEREQFAAQRRITEMEQNAAQQRIADAEKRLRLERLNQNLAKHLSDYEHARSSGITYMRLENYDAGISEFQRGINILNEYHNVWVNKETQFPSTLTFGWINLQESGSAPKIQELKLEIANCWLLKGQYIEAKRLFNELDMKFVPQSTVRGKIAECERLIAMDASQILDAVARMETTNNRLAIRHAKMELERVRELLYHAPTHSREVFNYQQTRIWWDDNRDTNTREYHALLSSPRSSTTDYRPLVTQLRQIKENFMRASKDQLLNAEEQDIYSQLSKCLPELEVELTLQIQREQREAERKRNVDLQYRIHQTIPNLYAALCMGDLPGADEKLKFIIKSAKAITKREDIVDQRFTPESEFHDSNLVLESALAAYQKRAADEIPEHVACILNICKTALTEKKSHYVLLKADLEKLADQLKKHLHAYWYKFDQSGQNGSNVTYRLSNAVKTLVVENIEEIATWTRYWQWLTETVRFQNNFDLENKIRGLIQSHPTPESSQPQLRLPMFALEIPSTDNIPTATRAYLAF